MSTSKSVLSIKNYGKIHVHLKEKMAERNLTRNYLAKVVNTRFEVIDKWYRDDVEKLDLDILARICYVLDCSPAELITYEN